MSDRSTQQRSLLAALVLSSVLTVFFTLVLLGLTAVGIGFWGYGQLKQFLTTAEVTPLELLATGYAGWTTTPAQTNGRQNILILGLDSLSTRGSAPPLTDTMIVLSIDLSSGQLNSLSLPRDLWQPEYLTRINALYFYGQERYPQKPYLFSQEVIGQMLGVPIHHTVVLTLEQVAELIDLVGGVTVDVPVAFADDQFPRPDVDVTVERDPAKLYQRVEFAAGPQELTGERALQYIRSRKAEGEAGGDGARVNRQQQVISALMNTMSQPQTLSNPAQAGRLFRFYQNNFAQYISLPEAIGLAKTLWPVRNQLQFVGHSLSVYPENLQGALVHPPLSEYNGQWVYVVRNQNIFEQEVKAALNLAE